MHGAVELCLLAGKGCDKIFIYLLLHIVTPSSGSLELPTTFFHQLSTTDLYFVEW